MIKKSRLKDIAEKAGVSISAVSKILNNTDINVTDKTRQRVFLIAEQLNYRPNILARGLARNKTNIIGVIAPVFRGISYASEICGEIEKTAGRHGYNVVVCNLVDDKEKLIRQLNFLVDQRVDGIITMLPDLPGIENVIRNSVKDIPFVAGNMANINKPAVDCVLWDINQGIFLAVKHLYDLKHRRIAYMSSEKEFAFSKYKENAVGLAIKKLGLTAKLNVIRDSYSFAGGKAAMKQLMKLHPETTAVLASGDIMALGALSCAAEMNIRVPQDISIIGFDNIMEICDFCEPALTTIDLGKKKLGKTVSEMLLEKIGMSAKRQAHSKVVIEPEIIIRQSTGELF